MNIGKIKYGICKQNHNVNSIDSYLINDYFWYNKEYIEVSDHIKDLRENSSLCLSKFPLFNIDSSGLGIASSDAIARKLKNCQSFTVLILH